MIIFEQLKIKVVSSKRKRSKVGLFKNKICFKSLKTLYGLSAETKTEKIIFYQFLIRNGVEINVCRT